MINNSLKINLQKKLFRCSRFSRLSTKSIKMFVSRNTFIITYILKYIWFSRQPFPQKIMTSREQVLLSLVRFLTF